MRKLLVAGGAVLFGSSAFAADLSFKAPPPAYSASDWSGFYIGVNGGAGWTDNGFSGSALDLAFPGFGSLLALEAASSGTSIGNLNVGRAKGGLIGGHFGYNWQFYNSIVAGLEIDADAADLTSSASTTYGSSPDTATMTVQDNVKALGSARGRVGWLLWNSFLLYGTGGLAWEHIEDSATLSGLGFGVGSPSPTAAGSVTNFQPIDRFGFVAGVGGETAVFSNHWLLRVEYLHYDFSKSASTSYNLGSSGSLATSYGNDTVDVVRGGLSYKF